MTWLITAVVVVGAVSSASAQKASAKAQANELEIQADQERVSAEGRELERRERLNKALSANIVGQSMSGISGEGTPESIALSNARTASLSESQLTLSDKLRQAQLKRQAANTKATGQAQSTSTLLKGASSVASLS